MKNKYRLRTEEELIELKGEDWKNCVKVGFVPDMDSFLGSTLNNEEQGRYEKAKKEEKTDFLMTSAVYNYDCWMVIKEEETIVESFPIY